MGLALAEAECLADGEARARRREREAEQRAELDRDHVEGFARRVRELFPNSPSGMEQAVAENACLRYSGRVGRSAAAKALDEKALCLAVVAHVRQVRTPYDELLAAGCDRYEARRGKHENVRPRPGRSRPTYSSQTRAGSSHCKGGLRPMD
jgi:hypothetical protein